MMAHSINHYWLKIRKATDKQTVYKKRCETSIKDLADVVGGSTLAGGRVVQIWSFPNPAMVWASCSGLIGVSTLPMKRTLYTVISEASLGYSIKLTVFHSSLGSILVLVQKPRSLTYVSVQNPLNWLESPNNNHWKSTKRKYLARAGKPKVGFAVYPLKASNE